MYHSTTIIPHGAEAPRAYLGGEDGRIPVVDLNAADPGVTVVQFSPADYDAAVEYLDHLADECSGLAAKIRLAQAAAQVQPQTVAGA